MKRLDGKPHAKPAGPHGLQGKLCRKTGISQAVMSYIMTGRRKPTPKQAALLEPLLLKEGYPITRWDMLYCPDGTPLLKAHAAEVGNEKGE